MTFCAADAILCETKFSIFKLMHDSIPKILLAAYCTIIIEYIPALDRHKSTRPQKNRIFNFPAAPVLRGHSPSALRTSSNKNVQAGLWLNILNAQEEAVEHHGERRCWLLSGDSDCQRWFPSFSPPFISLTPRNMQPDLGVMRIRMWPLGRDHRQISLWFPSSRLLRNKNVAWLLKRLPL